MNEYELYHHGIIGQRWGIRRYQNEDGTLTDAGKARYAKDVQRNNQKKKKDRADEDALRDPSRWVKEDLTRTKSVMDASSSSVQMIKQIKNAPKKREP